MGTSSRHSLPSQYDGTQFLIYTILPPGEWTAARLYPNVARVRVPGDFSPIPYFCDLRNEWWSLTSPIEYKVRELVWMIPLDQLVGRPRDDAVKYLEATLGLIQESAGLLGASVEAECSVPQAIEKIDRVAQLLKVRDYEAVIVIAVPEGRPRRVADWWRALEDAGLKYGDGNLFWMYDESVDDNDLSSSELFCAEPFTVTGYFHEGDLEGQVAFPDVALHFRARDVEDAVSVLHRMAQVGEHVAQTLNAVLLTSDCQPFDLSQGERDLRSAQAALSQLLDVT